MSNGNPVSLIHVHIDPTVDIRVDPQSRSLDIGGPSTDQQLILYLGLNNEVAIDLIDTIVGKLRGLQDRLRNPLSVVRTGLRDEPEADGRFDPA